MDKILYQVHCRYNYALSNRLRASHLYCGYVKKNNIEPEVMDLFGQLLKIAGYENPEDTQNKIYDYIANNIEHEDKLNILFNKFKQGLDSRKISPLPVSSEWKKNIDKVDKKLGRKKFNWTRYLTSSQ